MELAELGFTQEELQQRVVDQVCDRLLNCFAIGGEDGDEEYQTSSTLRRALDEAVQGRIDVVVNEIADKHVLPIVRNKIESIVLQETNRYGEKKGEPKTFIEYLVARAEEYMTEKVDYVGKPKGSDSYNWKASQTRLNHLIHEHLQYSIDTAMKEVLGSANKTVAAALAETCKVKLAEIASSLKVSVTTK